MKIPSRIKLHQYPIVMRQAIGGHAYESCPVMSSLPLRVTIRRELTSLKFDAEITDRTMTVIGSGDTWQEAYKDATDKLHHPPPVLPVAIGWRYPSGVDSETEYVRESVYLTTILVSGDSFVIVDGSSEPEHDSYPAKLLTFMPREGREPPYELDDFLFTLDSDSNDSMRTVSEAGARETSEPNLWELPPEWVESLPPHAKYRECLGEIAWRMNYVLISQNSLGTRMPNNPQFEWSLLVTLSIFVGGDRQRKITVSQQKLIDSPKEIR